MVSDVIKKIKQILQDQISSKFTIVLSDYIIMQQHCVIRPRSSKGSILDPLLFLIFNDAVPKPID